MAPPMGFKNEYSHSNSGMFCSLVTKRRFHPRPVRSPKIELTKAGKMS